MSIKAFLINNDREATSNSMQIKAGQSMAYTIAICDDCQEQLDLLRQFLNAYPGEDEFNIVQSTQPETLLDMLKETSPQVVFLDIDMGETNGITLGESIRKLHENAVIIYITAHEKYALEAFRVRAFHYLIKPVSEDKFLAVLREALQLIQRNAPDKPEKTFVVQKKGELLSLNYNDIEYFEKIGHKICLHAGDRSIDYYGNFSRLLQQIQGGSFLQCHQGYIVNIDKVRAFRDKTLFLDGNLQAPVSRSFVEGTKQALAKRLFAGKETQ